MPRLSRPLTLVVLLALAAIAAPTASAQDELPSAGILDLASTGSETSFVGEAASRAGWSVSAAGDVNGDRIGDVVIGAPGTDAQGKEDAGSAFVVFGRLPGGRRRGRH